MVSLEDISCNICIKEFDTNLELKYPMIKDSIKKILYHLSFKHLEAVMLESFLKKHWLIMEGYQGGQYIGPDCDKILSKLDPQLSS